MTYEGAISARLLASAAVTNAVGARVTWVERPQMSALPAIVLQTISDLRPQLLEGFNGLRSTIVQIDVWSATALQGVTIAQAIVDALAGPWRTGQHRFERTGFDGPRGTGEQVGGAFIHRQIIDVTFWHAQED